ncbi:MAG: helix-turn-helix transcriptional regulator, partial [Flavobacterium sp.]
HEARLQKGMTQEQLAEKAGTTKSYISKIENNVKEARFSTLQKIVEVGLGGYLELSIRL